MRVLIVVLAMIFLSGLVSGAAIPHTDLRDDDSGETFQLDTGKVKEKIVPIEPKKPVEPVDPLILKDIETVRLTNYDKDIEINLLDYVNSKDVRWLLSENELFDIKIVDNIMKISYDGEETIASEELKLRVSSTHKRMAHTEFKVIYVDVEKHEAPNENFPERNLFQDREYPEAEIILGVPATQTLDLNEGWNFISFSVLPDNINIENVFYPIIDSVTIVQSYVYNHYANEWKSYIPGAPQELQTLKTISPSQGYWVHTLSEETLVVDGETLDTVNYDLNEGWNLIGFPKTSSEAIDESIGSIKSNVEVIWNYDNEEWKEYNPLMPEFMILLHDFEPGKAYWIKVKQGMKLKKDASKDVFEFEELDNNNYEKKSYASLNGKTIAQNDDGEIKFYHHDYLGNVRAMTDSEGEVVWTQTNYPFGKQLNGSGEGNSLKFLGKEYDFSTGLILLGARYMDPEIGRFISADSYDGIVEDPRTFNKYAYAANNPMKYVDPTGNFFGLLGEAQIWEAMHDMYEAEMAIEAMSPGALGWESGYVDGLGADVDNAYGDLTFEEWLTTPRTVYEPSAVTNAVQAVGDEMPQYEFSDITVGPFIGVGDEKSRFETCIGCDYSIFSGDITPKRTWKFGRVSTAGSVSFKGDGESAGSFAAGMAGFSMNQKGDIKYSKTWGIDFKKVGRVGIKVGVKAKKVEEGK